MKEGYIRLLRAHLNKTYADFHVRIISAGISGNKIDDISQRFEHDVLRHNPNWIVISIGINEVWHRLHSSQHLNLHLPHFASELDSLVTKAQRQNIRVALCTTTVLTEDIDYYGNGLLQLYNDEIRGIAKNRSCLLIDLNTLFSDVLAKENRKTGISNLLTKDGVHLNIRGNRLMASAMLGAFGFGN
jgi:lysophospholipase L1-like esterase